jgi:hypothetical protein
MFSILCIVLPEYGVLLKSRWHSMASLEQIKEMEHIHKKIDLTKNRSSHN